ncbi:MAG: hypothetical protein AAGJ83_08750 [Planctomycetota bacterium]
MSVQESFRTFLLSYDASDQPIRQVSQLRVPESYDNKLGYIWYGMQNTVHNRTLHSVTAAEGVAPPPRLPDELFFDVEIYHGDPAVVETVANLLHSLDCYQGIFGEGTIGALFVDNQSDDYLPQVAFDQDLDLYDTFLHTEIRLYRE